MLMCFVFKYSQQLLSVYILFKKIIFGRRFNLAVDIFKAIDFLKNDIRFNPAEVRGAKASRWV